MDCAVAAQPWSFEPLQVVPDGARRAPLPAPHATLAARGQPVTPLAAGGFWTGIALVVLALNSPVDALGEEHFFFMHMTPARDARRPRAALLHARADRPDAPPGAAICPASSGCASSRTRSSRCPSGRLNLYVWHIPFLYDGALHHDAVHALEHFMFFTCGCLMWEPVVETLPAPAWFGTGWKLGYIFARAVDRDRARQRVHLDERDVLHRLRARAGVGDHAGRTT